MEKNKSKNTKIGIFGVIILIAVIVSGQFFNNYKISSANVAPIKAAVLYNGNDKNLYWKDTFSQLNQSIMLNFSVEAVDVSQEYDLNEFDIIYPDKYIIESSNSEKVKTDIISFVEKGGAAFLDNGFYSFFPKEFIGAKEYKKINKAPESLKIENDNEDLQEITGIIFDFTNLYKGYNDSEELLSQDYGYAVEPSTAKTLVSNDVGSLYTLNEYKDGIVFFTNPLLPNIYSLNGFSMESRDENQKSLANTTVSSNQIILNKFAEYVSKEKYGFSLSRVFGSFGRPSMAWQLHYEEITGIENDSAIIFGELAKKHNQIPSYTLIRNAFKWFSRYETVTYIEGAKDENSNNIKYNVNFDESAYSSGKHVVSGDKFLSINEMEDAGSYFVDNTEYINSAYPWIGDMDNDGIKDILSGSSDGKLYLFKGKENNERFSVNEPIKITDLNKEEIYVDSYSAPVVFDINGDEIKDIVFGSGEGVIYVSLGTEKGFESKKVLIDTSIDGQSFPEIGDLNGDGKLDLLVGTNQGKLISYYGKETNKLSISEKTEYNISQIEGFSDIGNWIAPRLYDLDQDGVKELYLGTFDGYIAKLMYKDNKLDSKGYIEVEEKNYKGNHRIKFGNNCVPLFTDINNDKVDDIVAGQLEYGLAYPIDSPYFPYKDELKKQVDYILDNNMYLGTHFYTNVSASTERENFELDAHLKSFEYYGIPTDEIIGTNQHTWSMSEYTQKQTLVNGYNNGMYWTSGFRPSNTSFNPERANENGIVYPFFLEHEGEKTMLVHNSSVMGYNNIGLEHISAKYDAPISLYYHCDFVYENEAQAMELINIADKFQDRYSYNFVSEDQMMFANAAAYNLDINVNKKKTDLFDIKIDPIYKGDDHTLNNEDYLKSSGLKISLSKELKDKAIVTDANVVQRIDNNIYVSADKPFRVFESSSEFEQSKLRRVNIAANISQKNNNIEIEFLDNGMLQCVVEGQATTNNQGWDVVYNEEVNSTTFTKFGDEEKLIINY